MYKKIFTSLITLFLLTTFACVCFAADENVGQDAVNGIRNVVGGAENAIEDAAKDVSNTSKQATSDMENGANDMMGTNNNDGNYTATRTSTDAQGNATLLGMNAKIQ